MERRKKISLPNYTRSSFILIVLILVGAGLGFFPGCETGPTNKELLQQYKPRLMELRATLRQIAAKIPDSAEEMAPEQLLDPLPEYAQQSWEIANTDILMYEQLLNPDTTRLIFDLNLSNYLMKTFRQMSPQYDMGKFGNKPAGKKAGQRYEQILGIRYLGVARVVAYQKPVLELDERGRPVILGGSVTVDGYLVDVTSPKILCAFRITNHPDGNFLYLKSDKEDKKAAMQRGVSISFRNRTQKMFMEKLARLSGGRFARESW